MPAYFNAAGHGLPSDGTVIRMRQHLDREVRVGPIAALEEGWDEIMAVPGKAAALIGAASEDAGLANTTTAAWLAIVARLPMKGKRLLVAPHEWGPNIAFLRALAGSADATIEVLPKLDLDASGPSAPDLSEWAERIDEDVAAIFAPMVTSISGLAYPVAAIGALPRPAGTRLVIDAAQALGQVPIDIGELGCDALIATCRKRLRGPRATALFWLNSAAGLGFVPSELEPTDSNAALRLGLGNAIDEALETGIDAIGQEVAGLAAKAYDKARALGLDTLTGTPPMTSTLCLAVADDRRPAIATALSGRGLVVKWPDPVKDEPYGTDGGPETAALRISPHLYNNEPELDELFGVIGAALD